MAKRPETSIAMSNFQNLSQSSRSRFIQAWLIAGRTFDDIDEALVNDGQAPVACGEFALATDSAHLIAA
jgi:hypothetical protein